MTQPSTANAATDQQFQRELNRRSFLGDAVAASLGCMTATTLVRSAQAASAEPSVHTVLGPVPAAKLGAVLMHEHAPLIDWSELYETKTARFESKREEILSSATRQLQRFHESLSASEGPGAIVECTPIRVGRYPELLRELAGRLPLHVIGCTGFWGEGLAPPHRWAVRLSLQERGVAKIADLYVREITEGMEDPSGEWGERFTDVKAGVIKCATSSYMRPVERRCHLAAAIASKQTGCPITTHTTGGGGLEEIELFLKQGVSPEKVIIGHQGHRDDRQQDDAAEYHRRIVASGCFIQFDRVGSDNYSPKKTARQIRRLVEAGFARQILVSHDSAPCFYEGFSTEEKPVEGWKFEEADYTIVTTDLVSALKVEGLSEADVHAILVANPQRVLAF